MNEITKLLRQVDISIESRMFEDALYKAEKALSMRCSSDPLMQLILKCFHKKELDIAKNLAFLTLKYYPTNYHLLNTLGVILKSKGEYIDALSVLKKAAQMMPNLNAAWINMGNVYVNISEFENALKSFEYALNATPNDPEIMRLKACAHIRLGQSDIAESILRKAIILKPKNVLIMTDLFAACYNQRSYDQALEYINNSIAINGQDIDLLKKKALVLKALGRGYDAINIYEQILCNEPNNVSILLEIGHLYNSIAGDSYKAKEYYERAYKIDPKNIRVLESLCEFFLYIKKLDGSQEEFIAESYKYAQELINVATSMKEISGIIQLLSLKLLDYEMYEKLGTQKDLLDYWVSINDSRPFVSNLSRVKTMEDRLNLLNAHKVCGAFVESKATGVSDLKKVRQKINNKIRIGIMSSDLRMHPVGYFVWPLIEHLDRNKFEIYCYSFFPYEIDDMQRNIMNRVDGFKTMLQESALQAAQKIAYDNLDILFELSGKTRFNKTEACIYRPAPVQVSWLGYPHSLGFEKSIDYIVVDPYINPENPDLILEKPFLLPNTWVSIDEKVGFMDYPVEKQIPQDKNGFITFGSMNASHKITAKTLSVWAEIMNLVPGSRFLYVRPEADSKILQNNFCKYMELYGISSDRISFASTHTEHMKYYNHIDIALDTFPHTGGTTTCETLWMGVPVVALVGSTFFERLSYSNLSNSGLSDLCGSSVSEYVRIAVDLSKDIDRRRYLKANLRQQILSNPLGKPIDFACDFAKTTQKILGAL